MYIYMYSIQSYIYFSICTYVNVPRYYVQVQFVCTYVDNVKFSDRVQHSSEQGLCELYCSLLNTMWVQSVHDIR